MGVKIREKPQGSGIWWVFINHHGRRKSKMIGRDKSLANKVAKKLREKTTNKEFNLEELEISTFGEYAQTWLAVTVPATCKPSTADDHKRNLKNHIYPVFKNKPVTEINKTKVERTIIKGEVVYEAK